MLGFVLVSFVTHQIRGQISSVYFKFSILTFFLGFYPLFSPLIICRLLILSSCVCFYYILALRSFFYFRTRFFICFFSYTFEVRVKLFIITTFSELHIKLFTEPATWLMSLFSYKNSLLIHMIINANCND